MGPIKGVHTLLLIVLIFGTLLANGLKVDTEKLKYKAEPLKKIRCQDYDLDENKGFKRGGYYGRRLTQSGTSRSCAWYEEEEICRSNSTVPAQVLSNSKDSFANYVAHIFTCFSATNKESCLDKDICRWNYLLGTCSLGFYTAGYEKSPCVKAAPATAQRYATSIACQRHETSVACNRGANCTWLEDEEVCIEDVFPIIFGLESSDSFLTRLNDTYVTKRRAIVDVFLAQFLPALNSPSFNWSRVLNWKVPNTRCPASVTTTECNYLDVYLENIIPTLFYCSLRYNNALSCFFDSRCTYDSNASLCTPTDDILDRATRQAALTLLDRVQARVDRDLLSVSLSCPTITEWSDCNGKCQWDYQERTCKSNITYMQSRLGAAGKRSKRGRRDPVCKLSLLEADSRCHSIQFPRRCRRDDKCWWTVAKDCGVSDEHFLKSAIENARDIDESPDDLIWSECIDFTTKRQCLAFGD